MVNDEPERQVSDGTPPRRLWFCESVSAEGRHNAGSRHAPRVPAAHGSRRPWRRHRPAEVPRRSGDHDPELDGQSEVDDYSYSLRRIMEQGGTYALSELR